MGKETVLIVRLLLKPMTKTSQLVLNDIAIMTYHGGWPVLKVSLACFFAIVLMKITRKK